MNTDEKVTLGMRIAGKLVGITPSEWAKWCSYVECYGLKRALQFSRTLQNSPSLRPGPKQAYRTIVKVIQHFYNQLKMFSHQEITEVLGYARWALYARKVGYYDGHRRY